MSVELLTRIRRIYAAIEASHESDMSKLPSQVVRSDRFVGVHQDFSGGMSEEDMSNAAHTVIHNIANLRDHLRRWAARNGKDKAKVDAAFAASVPLRIIQDLSNNDKHGPARDGGNSGLAPALTEIRRVMKLTPRAQKGSCVVMFMGMDGKSQIHGDGSATAVVTGEVIDKDGSHLGELFDIEQRAVQAWESLLTDLGVVAANSSS